MASSTETFAAQPQPITTIAVQRLEVMAGVFGFDVNRRYLEGCLLAEQYGCASVVARRMVGEGIHAYLALLGSADFVPEPSYAREGNAMWTPNASPKGELARLRELAGEGSEAYQIGTELMALPSVLERDTVRIYCERCVEYGLEVLGVHRTGVPFMERHTSDREPRYRFLKAWGKIVVDHGIVTSYPDPQLRSAIAGGRRNVAPSFAELS